MRYGKYIYGLIIGSLVLGFGLQASANSRGLDGVEYTSRQQRGADESRRYENRPEYKKIIEAQNNASDGDDKNDSAAKRKTATDYVLKYFADQFKISSVTKIENGSNLFWPLQYANKKNEIIVHHTATDGILPQTVEEEKKFMVDVYKFHAFGRGRGDIGYNFIIMPSGRIYEGRAGGAGVIGAHATWNNTSSIGISMVGNFENIQPTQAQIDALVALSTSIAKKYEIDISQQKYYFKAIDTFPYIKAEKYDGIAGHRDAGLTKCPGEALYDLLPAIKQEVVRRYNGQSPESVKLPVIVTDSPELTAIKQAYIKKNPITPSKASIKRLEGAPTSAKIPLLVRNLVRVLLYEVSLRDTRTLQCDTTCLVRINGTIVRSQNVKVAKQKSGFLVVVGTKKISSSKFAVSAGDTGKITITDFIRKTSNGIDLNVFRQSLLFVNGPMKLIDGTTTNQQQVINIVSLDNYMHGIGEASDQEEQTKANLLALLAKGYALYYMGGTVKHPSIPEGAYFNAIDDPRLFQKYIGAGWESVSTKRPVALEQTKNIYLTYNGKLPILPYFHCSAGFTWSAKEKRGWKDTSYLTSVTDSLGMCDSKDFEGHGVGLSGKGAAAMTKQGKTVADIIQYYYSGVQLTTVK